MGMSALSDALAGIILTTLILVESTRESMHEERESIPSKEKHFYPF